MKGENRKPSRFDPYLYPQVEIPPCHCRQGAEFGWRLQLGSPASASSNVSLRQERRLQRDFIHKHTKAERKNNKAHKFIKSMSAYKRNSNRWRREVAAVEEEEEEEE